MTTGTEPTPQQNSQAVVTKEVKAFGVQTVERSSELASVAVASAAQAEVEAAYKMAILAPRHEETARTQILAACRNPRFAEKARYRKPVGRKEIPEGSGNWQQQFIIGASIRLAEHALRCWKNVLVQQVSLYDDQIKRIVRVTTKDVEANVGYSKELNLEKTVERSSGKDREILGQRVNSYGRNVFIVRSTEDELNIKESALASKVIRTNGLRLIPTHIVDEAMDEIEATLKDKAAKDPEGERRAILDGFAKRGVSPLEIERYMSKPSAQFSAQDLVELRDMLTSIEDGHVTWQEFLEGTSAQTTEEIQEKSQPETKGVEVNEKLKTVAQERGVETVKTPVQEPSKQVKDLSEQAQEPAKTPGLPPSIAKPDTTAQEAAPTGEDLEALKNQIASAEFSLKSSEVGKKKYQAVLGVMKIRLSGKQQPLDILPMEHLKVYLAQLTRAMESLKK